MLQAERLEKIKEYLVKNEFADINRLSEFQIGRASCRERV